MSELADGRDALAYWERRARTLPRHAVRRRREARAMAVRWSERVAEAEREAYGHGVLGALLLLGVEGRVPEGVRRTGRSVARRGGQALAVAGLMCLALLAASLALVAELVSAIV
ncbi:MAG: hypothetical protein ACXVFK_07165 [Solirubrobacteraceae bacterium]